MPDPKEPLKDVTSALENEDVVTAVEKRLGETFGDVPAEDLKDEGDSTPDDDSQADDSKSKDDSTPDEDQENKDETGDTDGDENKDAPPKPDEKPDDKEDKKFELPDAFQRAAEHDGWKSKDVKDFFETDPERALVTFQNIYNSMNRASRDFANLGRIKAEQTRQQAEAATKTDEKVEIKDFIDIAKL
ncbi:hypothetical protein KA005_08785, partial [bacterium]|nr:hypothetical protein [bacterium]